MREAEKIWFLHDGNERSGPHTLQEAALRLFNETASGVEYFAWRQGMTDWKKAAEIEELKAKANEFIPPPSPQESLPQELPADPKPSSIESTEQPPTPAEGDGLSALIEVRPSPLDDNMGTEKTASAARAQAEVRLPDRTKYAFALLTLVAVSAIGYEAWPLLMKPTGLIGRWVIRLPDTPELSAEQRHVLETAAFSDSGSSDPSQAAVEIILAGPRKDAPTAYIASNLADNSSLTLELQAEPALVAGPPPLPIRVTVFMIHRLGHSEPLRATDGSTLPRGQYRATLWDSEGRTRLSRQLWVGEERNSAFNQELANYHREIKSRAQAELQNLKDAATKIGTALEGDAQELETAGKTRNAAARARLSAMWTADRAKILDEVNALLLPEAHFFRKARNAVIVLRDAAQAHEAGQLSPARAESQSPQTPTDEWARRVSEAKADVASLLSEAERKMATPTDFIEEEK